MKITQDDTTICLNDIWEYDYHCNETVDPVKWVNSEKGKLHRSKIKGHVVDNTIRYTTTRVVGSLYKVWAKKLLDRARKSEENKKQTFEYCLTDFWVEQNRPENRDPYGWVRYSGKGYKTYKRSIRGVNKTYTDDKQAFEMYKKWVLKDEGSNPRFYKVREKAALDTIEQLLHVELIRQYPVCGKYYIDGYDPINNIAYEIDEEQHFTSRHQAADRKREEEIRYELGCEFVRIKV